MWPHTMAPSWAPSAEQGCAEAGRDAGECHVYTEKLRELSLFSVARG